METIQRHRAFFEFPRGKRGLAPRQGRVIIFFAIRGLEQIEKFQPWLLSGPTIGPRYLGFTIPGR
jgi:hypothetical protein